MSDDTLFEIISPVIFFCGVYFAIAEFIGRSKHIGRWWTFFLMFPILPGIIALIFSPSAKNKATKGNKAHLIFGIFFLLVAVYSFFSRIDNYEISDFFSNVGLLATGFYLINFANGKVINNNPKFYFKNSKPTIPIQTIQSQSSENFTNSNLINHQYFIIENNVQNGPYFLNQLIEKGINEKTMVWRKGFENWKKASEINEIENIILYNPPPIPTEQESKPPPIPKNEIIPNKYWINGKGYTIEEIESELQKGNYIIYKDSIIYDNSGNEILIKDTHQFLHLIKYFPPD